MRAIWIVLLLLAPPAFAADEEEKPKGKTARTDFRVSYARFSSYYDGTTKRSLDRSYSETNPARNVSLDALVISFDGRYDLGGGLGAGVAFPLVRASRGGRREIVLASESLFAESISIGDLVADLSFVNERAPLSPALVGFLQIPVGAWEDLAREEMPTGSGTWSIGGEVSARADVVQRFRAGGAVGTAFRMERSDGLDRGDPFWLRAWGATKVTEAVSFGSTLAFFTHPGDRIDGQAVPSLPPDLVFGAPTPAQRLLSIAPWVEIRPVETARILIAISDPGIGWMFFPLDNGYPLAGKNIFAGDVMLTVSISARF